MEKKRKRPSTDSFVEHESSRQDEEIQRLESKATLSPKYYNNIATVLSIIRDAGTNYRPDGGATLALCRIFTRLFVSGQFRNTKTHTQEEFLVQKWLEEKYSEFIAFLLEALDRRSLIDSNLAMTILMKLIQCEVCCQGHHMWATGLFSHVFRTIFKQPSQLDAAKGIFINEYFLKYDDVRLNSLQLLVLVYRLFSRG
jgi:U3 small nucleolar RNA-associated protein 19